MNELEGTAPLVRLAMRRDRILLPAWIIILALTAASSAAAVKGLYPDVQSRLTASAAVNNSAALVAMFGRIADPTSVGAIAMIKMVAFGSAAVAVLTSIIVVRHTRAEEENGRLELVGATVVGRRAPLAAALIVATFTSALLGFFVAVGLTASGLPLAGAVTFGASWFGTGVAFAAAAAIAAQVARTARNATGLSIGFIGVAYVARAIGDTSARLSWLTWVSPLGWAHHVQSFAGDHLWVVVLPLLFSMVLIPLAFVLRSRRDLGAGLLVDKPGPAAASASLGSVVGLAWRLERSSLLAWATAFALLGVVVGGVAGDVGSFLDTPAGQDIIFRMGGTKALVDAYLAAEFGVMGVVIAAYGVHAALRLRTEETSQRAEAVLSTGVSRRRWIGSHLLVAVLGTTVLAVVMGLSAGAARAVSTGQLNDLPRITVAAMVVLPAVWVVVGIVALAFGFGARFAMAGWIALVVFLLLGEVGPVVKLPARVIELSPFAHVPKLPGSAFTLTPVLVLLAVAVALTAVGLSTFARRDVG